MKSYMTYVCKKCGKESRNSDEISQCEASHLGLTVEDNFRYEVLKEIVRSRGCTVSTTKNSRTENDFDEAIKSLIQFEKMHGIVTK